MSIAPAINSEAIISNYEVMFMHRHAQLTGNWEYGSRIKRDLEQVLNSDPEFALGWALLGEIYGDRHAHQYFETSVQNNNF